MTPAATGRSGRRPARSWFYIGLAAGSLLAAGFAAARLTLVQSPRARIATAGPEGAFDKGGHETRRERWVPPRFMAPRPVAGRARPEPRPMRELAADRTTWSSGPASSAREATTREDLRRTPQVIARERRLRQTIDGIRASSPGVTIRFASCERETCVGQVQSSQPAEIDRFAQAARRLSPGYEVRVRERLTAFNGRLWEAELIAQPDTGMP
jgi:hypothetical protein